MATIATSDFLLLSYPHSEDCSVPIHSPGTSHCVGVCPTVGLARVKKMAAKPTKETEMHAGFAMFAKFHTVNVTPIGLLHSSAVIFL